MDDNRTATTDTENVAPTTKYSPLVYWFCQYVGLVATTLAVATAVPHLYLLNDGRLREKVALSLFLVEVLVIGVLGVVVALNAHRNPVRASRAATWLFPFAMAASFTWGLGMPPTPPRHWELLGPLPVLMLMVYFELSLRGSKGPGGVRGAFEAVFRSDPRARGVRTGV